MLCNAKSFFHMGSADREISASKQTAEHKERKLESCFYIGIGVTR